MTTAKTVDDYFAALPPPEKEIAEALQDVIRKAVPSLGRRVSRYRFGQLYAPRVHGSQRSPGVSAHQNRC